MQYVLCTAYAKSHLYIAYVAQRIVKCSFAAGCNNTYKDGILLCLSLFESSNECNSNTQSLYYKVYYSRQQRYVSHIDMI